MGRKFIKDADTGEIYLLPDEKQALKNIPSFLNEAIEEREGISESYERNNSIFDLQKQLHQKDKQLKKATRNKVVFDNNALIACFVVLGIVLVLTIVIAASIISNNKPTPVMPVSELSAAPAPSNESYISPDVLEDEDNSYNSDDNKPVVVSEPVLNDNPYRSQNQYAIWEALQSETAQYFVKILSPWLGLIIGAYIFLKIVGWGRGV